MTRIDTLGRRLAANLKSLGLAKVVLLGQVQSCIPTRVDLPQVYFVNQKKLGKGKAKFTVSGRLIKDDEIDLGQVYEQGGGRGHFQIFVPISVVDLFTLLSDLPASISPPSKIMEYVFNHFVPNSVVTIQSIYKILVSRIDVGSFKSFLP